MEALTFEQAKDKVAKKFYNTKFVFLTQIHERDCLTRAAELTANSRAAKAWEDACDAQLALVSKTFKENGHKGSFNDQPVFQAISETISNHPKPTNPYLNLKKEL